MDVKFLQFMRDFVAEPTGGEGKNAGGASSESPNTKISISPESKILLRNMHVSVMRRRW